MIFLVFVELVSVGIDKAVLRKVVLSDFVELAGDLGFDGLDGLLWGDDFLDLHEDVLYLDVGLFVHWGLLKLIVFWYWFDYFKIDSIMMVVIMVCL